MRRLGYDKTDVILLCFCVVYPYSFENLKYWYDEVRAYNPYVPILLVGTKTDLRDEPQYRDKIVSSQKAIQLTKKLDFASYFECSAKTQHGLKQVFETAIEIAIEKRRKFQYYTPPPLPTADPAFDSNRKEYLWRGLERVFKS